MKDYHLWIIGVFGQAIKICHVLGRSRDFFLENIRYVVVDIYRSFEPLWNISYPSYMKQLDTISGFIFIQQSHIIPSYYGTAFEACPLMPAMPQQWADVDSGYEVQHCWSTLPKTHVVQKQKWLAVWGLPVCSSFFQVVCQLFSC